MSTALAMFDFDGTMVKGDSILPYLRYAWQQGALPFSQYVLSGMYTVPYFFKRITDEQMKSQALTFLHTLPASQQKELDEGFVKNKLLPRVYADALQTWQTHKKNGLHMLLVSASTENYMRYVADALGADALLCTPLKPQLAPSDNCKGEEKPRRIHAYLERAGIEADFAASYAYGDSKSDLPMLRLCGHPVCVNAKPALQKAAPEMQQVNWK